MGHIQTSPQCGGSQLSGTTGRTLENPGLVAYALPGHLEVGAVQNFLNLLSVSMFAINLVFQEALSETASAPPTAAFSV